MTRGRLTPAEKIRIDELSASGWSSGRIAQRLNRHPSTIHFYMVTHGLKAMQDRPRGIYERRGIQIVGFTRDEDAFIEALRVQSFSYTKIAALVAKRFNHHRTPAVIGVRLKMLGSRDLAETA